MATALVLEFLPEWLRSKHNWEYNQCGVTIDAEPPPNAGDFFIGIEDAGVETGDERTHSLKEIVSLNLAIWKRPEHLPKFKRGILKLPNDMYVLGAWSLYDLERALIFPRLNGLHLNFDFTNSLNERYNLPHADYGAKFTFPLAYRGKGRMERMAIDRASRDPEAWYGYRLRFRGLQRETKLFSGAGTTEAQG